MKIVHALSIQDIAQFTVSPYGVRYFCICLIFISLSVYLFGYRRKVFVLARNLKNAIKVLKESVDPISFAAEFSSLDKHFCENKDIDHSWCEFKETLVMPPATETKPVICNTDESVCFFNEDTVIAKRINLRFYNSFPNYLTGAGIMGTFLGLVAGIYLASQGLASENTSVLKESLENLLSGASLAFWTSICGLFCSILFSWREKVTTHQLNLLLGEWNKEMDYRIERITPESLARSQLNQLEKQSEYLEEFTTQIAFNIAEALNERLNEKIVPVMERMIDAVDMLRKDRGESNDEILKKIVQQFSKTMEDAAGKELNALSETLSTLNETLAPLLDQMNEAHQNMQGAALYISEQIKESYARSSKEFTEGVQSAITDLVNGISNAGNTLNGDLKDAFDHAVERLQDTIENLDGSILNVKEAGENTEKIAEATKGLLTRFDVITESFSGIQEKLQSSLSSLERTAETIKEGGDAASDMSLQANRALFEFKEVVNKFQSSQEIIEATWGNYADRFESVDSSLEGVFRKIEDGLQSYAQATSKYMADLDRHSAKVTGLLGGAVTDLDESLQEFSEALSYHRN